MERISEFNRDYFKFRSEQEKRSMVRFAASMARKEEGNKIEIFRKYINLQIKDRLEYRGDNCSYRGIAASATINRWSHENARAVGNHKFY